MSTELFDTPQNPNPQNPDDDTLKVASPRNTKAAFEIRLKPWREIVSTFLVRFLSMVTATVIIASVLIFFELRKPSEKSAVSVSQPERKIGDFVIQKTAEIITETMKEQGQNTDNPIMKEFVSELVSCVAPTLSFDYSQDDIDKMTDEEAEKVDDKLAQDISAALIPCLKTVVQNASKKK